MATAPPILVWSPAGGVPVGPISNPPVYSQAGTTQLVEDQAYIDVVFGSIQTDDEWVLVECVVVNETDLEPLNIWPGIITDKAAAGFRLQLNGMPDSNNYYLHWAVSGINITPSPASTYLLSGPSSGGIGVASTFTVSLPPSTTLPGTLTVTPSDDGGGGSFSPTSVALSTTSASATFTYTPASYGAKTISVVNSGTLTNPAPLTFTPLAVTYTLSGPSSGSIGVASTNFTVALPVGGSVTGTVTVTPSDSGDGGTFTPTTVALTTAAPSATFTYTPATSGTKTISTTNNGGLTDPVSLSYLAAFDPSTVAGLKLWLKADSMALADGTAITSWTDSSSNAYNLTSGTATFKTGIVNGKPVVRFNGTSNRLYTAVSLALSQPYNVFIVANIGAGGGQMMSSSPPFSAIGLDSSGFFFGYFGALAAGAINRVGAFHLFDILGTGGTAYTWVDDVSELAAAASGTNAITVVNLMHDGTSTFFAGDIAEILIYDATTEGVPEIRAEITDYLRSKYGL